MNTNLVIYAPAELHREAWRTLLEKQPAIEVSGCTGELSDIPRLGRPGATTILVDMSHIQAALVGKLHELAPAFGLLLLVENFDLAQIVDSLRAGATGFIARDSSVGDLSRAIIATGRGEIVLPPELAAQALVALARGEQPSASSADSPTEREREVLGLLAQGYTNKDIAQSLVLSVRTVEAHLHSIYGKLGVASRTEAALWAVSHGYGSPG
jgi:DNA-binding NarL/FixJ family response regulator